MSKYSGFTFAFFILSSTFAYATPSTYIWTPSTDVQPYKKIHLNVDNYTPLKSRDHNGNRLYVQQVYGPTFSLLSDKPEDNLLGKLWSPLGKIMAETGFDYKKGFGPVLDKIGKGVVSDLTLGKSGPNGSLIDRLTDIRVIETEP